MAIVVTGAGGFIGLEVVRRLAATGRDVIAADARVPPESGRPDALWVEGDLTERAVRDQLFARGCRGLIHLAAVPGGAAESNPPLSRKVNIDATLDLLDAAADAGTAPRVVFASTIAVYGDPLPKDGVDDQTPLRPRMIYGAQKAMIETMVGTLSRRGAINGVSPRLPGIVARPRGPSGMKSAFMSEIFHAMRAGEPFVSPVSRDATLWLMSVAQVASNLLHALEVDSGRLPENRAFTLPALRVTMAELADAAARYAGRDRPDIRYDPDERLEAAFGAHPALSTPAANAAGFRSDGDIETLVKHAMETI